MKWSHFTLLTHVPLRVIFGIKTWVVFYMPLNACCCYSSLFFALNVHKNSVKISFMILMPLRFSVTSVINQHFVNVYWSDHSPLLIFRAVSKHSINTNKRILSKRAFLRAPPILDPWHTAWLLLDTSFHDRAVQSRIT